MLCAFRHIFGREGEGVHAIRILDVAVVDVALTLIGALALARWRGWNPFGTVAICFALGVLAHRLFCVRTTLDRLLFPDGA